MTKPVMIKTADFSSSLVGSVAKRRVMMKNTCKTIITRQRVMMKNCGLFIITGWELRPTRVMIGNCGLFIITGRHHHMSGTPLQSVFFHGRTRPCARPSVCPPVCPPPAVPPALPARQPFCSPVPPPFHPLRQSASFRPSAFPPVLASAVAPPREFKVESCQSQRLPKGKTKM